MLLCELAMKRRPHIRHRRHARTLQHRAANTCQRHSAPAGPLLTQDVATYDLLGVLQIPIEVLERRYHIHKCLQQRLPRISATQLAWLVQTRGHVHC